MIDLAVGLSGKMLAGKTTAARFLERHGFAYTRISEVIDDVLLERGEAITRENQQRVGLELHETKGQRWLCERALRRLIDSPTTIVIDGLRWPDDARYFRERFGERFRHIDIFAPRSARRERASLSHREEEFDYADQHPVEEGVKAVGEMADVVITNDSDIAAFEDSVSNAIWGKHVDAR